MQVIWTTEQVLGLAPDDNLQKSSRVLAVPEKWSDLGSAKNLVWGRYVIQARSDFHVVADLNHLSFSCTCKNRKFPCNHALALTLMAVELDAEIPSSEKPSWVKDFEQVSARPQPDAELLDFATRHNHQRQLMRGLAELELWLHDLARTGIANLPNVSDDAWEARAGRLVDNRAPALAAEVRLWKQIVATDKRWTDQLVRRIGRTYLLIQALKNSDNLPASTQQDLYRAVGWPSFASHEDKIISDRWLVIGSTTEQRGSRFTQHSYLIGQQSGSAAQILQRRGNNRQQLQPYVTGTALTATLRQFVGQTPLAAQMVSCEQVEQVVDIQSFCYQHEYAASLEKNPFIGAWPHLVKRSSIWQTGGSWFIGDGEEAMLISASVANAAGRSKLNGATYLWHLKALEGTPCFGLWDGARFRPLSVWADGRLLDLRMLRGVA